MTKEKKVKLPEGVTEEHVKAWKERYGEDKVKYVELPKDDDGDEYFGCIVRVPARKELSEFEKWVDKNPDKAKEVMINACVLTGKEIIKADDGLFLGAFDALAKLIPVRISIVKNL